MSTLTLNVTDIAPDFHSSATACRKRLFVPVEQDLDQEILDFVSQFSDKKKFRSEDYTFSHTSVVPVPAPNHRKRQLQAAEEEDELDAEFQDFPANKKSRSEDYTFRAEWVNMLVSEMTAANSVEDAKSRGARLFDAFKNSVSVGEEAEALEKKTKAVAQENEVLKRAVVKLEQRHVKYEEAKNEEVKQMKEVVGKYEEKVKSLEMDNYRLDVNLKQAMRPNPNAMGHRYVY